jgi:hypothetical protein
MSAHNCPSCLCGNTVTYVTLGRTAENSTWGECVGEGKLCDGGTVKDDPRFTCGYQCTGGKHIGPGRYVRCTDASHRLPVSGLSNTVFVANTASGVYPVYPTTTTGRVIP